jgi:hypothetical protein
MRLHPTVAHMPGEELMSFVARLAHRNGIATIREFCFDLGLSMRRLADGDVTQVIRLAEIAGSDVNALLRESRRREGTTHRIRDQILTTASLTRPHFRACPACLAEDLQRSNGIIRNSSIYHRTIWSIQHIRTCAEHGVGLVDIFTEEGESAYDFPRAVGKWLDGDSQKLSDRVDRTATSFERYLIRRLDVSEGRTWLDQMPFYAAAKTCEIIGIVKAYGRDQNSKYLTNAEWAHAGKQGFDVACCGADGIRDFLIQLWKDFPGARGSPAGPKAWFGRLYHWLEYETKDSVYDPVRAVIVKSIADHIPFHPNEMLFGNHVPYRKIHSIGTASHETKISERRLRTVLERAGHIAPGHAEQVAHDIHFDAIAAAPLLSRLSSALSAEAASSLLGVKCDTLRMLVRAGLLNPIDRHQSATAAPLFNADDVSAFMFTLREGAESISQVPKMSTDVVSAVSRTHSSLVDILSLVAKRELDWVGWLPDIHGIRSIIVNVGELRECLRRESLRGLMRRQVACELAISTTCARKLVEMRVLPSIIQKHPTTRYRVSIVEQEHCLKFKLKYIKTFEAAKLLGASLVSTKRMLNANGIIPKLTKSVYGMDFYLRAEVVELAENLQNSRTGSRSE